MELSADRDLLADAGQLVDRHAMIWIRRLNAPVEQVWKTVSTIEGLKTWWVVPPTKFELCPDGIFEHHWQNKVTNFRENEYIDFVENTGAYQGTGGMRFELKDDGQATTFMFLDTWGENMTDQVGEGDSAEQAGGPGTPWPGVAAGWHCMMNKLESVINNCPQKHAYEELCTFYLFYLRDLYRWHDMVQRTPS